MDPFLPTSLRYFLAVVEHGSIREAARSVQIASSAIHRQINLLEQQLDIDLFERSNRGLILSEAGQVLYDYAQSACLQIQDIQEKLADLKNINHGFVQVATVESIADSFLPGLLTLFYQQYPGIDLDVAVMTSYQVEQSMIAGKAHVGFMFNPTREIGLQELYSRDFRIGAIVAQDHPLTRERDCCLAHCLQYPLILPAQNMSLAQLLDPALSRLRTGNKPASVPTMRVNSLRLMRHILTEGQHVGFQTILGVGAADISERLTFLKLIDDDIPSDRLAIVTQMSRQLASAPRQFSEMACSYLTNYLRG